MQLIIIETEGRGLPSFRYRHTVERNPDFDGAAFIQSWARFVGSTHRHYQTGELVLYWSPNGPHPQEREMLRARLEADARNIGAVLAAVAQRDERTNAAVLAANEGRA